MRLDGNGNLLDGVPFVITQAQAGQENPQVAWNGTHWLVVFESYAVTAGGYYQKSLVAVETKVATYPAAGAPSAPPAWAAGAARTGPGNAPEASTTAAASTRSTPELARFVHTVLSPRTRS